MLALYLLPLVAQLVAPLALLVWLWLAPGHSRASALVRLFMTAAYLVAITLAGVWLIVPRFLATVYLVVLALQACAAALNVRSKPSWPHRRAEWGALALYGLLAIAFAGVAGTAVGARWLPREQIVDLAFPLRDGTYVVANGGTSSLINAHVQTLTAARFRHVRGQSYGVDIVEVDRFGRRASGVVPRDPRAYVIAGRPIHAPCSGTVLRAEDGRPDMPPPQPDRDHLPGNFVFMECAGVRVLLAHMQRGTVAVSPGDRLEAGAVVGRVGNSGNTNEPHLHIHAQRPAANDAFLSGDPLPLRLDGRFLVRNDRVRAPPR
jgi:hypothetical protein